MSGHRPWMSIFVCGAILTIAQHTVNAAPGRVGCFYDLKLCEGNELCFNDSLFGTCISQITDAINYNNLEPTALNDAAQVLQYLIEAGYKWQDSYTQCVVGKYLQSVVSGERYNPEVCEYLKAILDVIDRNGGANKAVDQDTMAGSQPKTDSLVPAKPPITHGEFISRLEDLDISPSNFQETAQSPGLSQSVIDPNANAGSQDYNQEVPQVVPDPVVLPMEKKSGNLEEFTSTAPPTDTTSQPITTSTDSTITSSSETNQTASIEQNAAEDAIAMQNLFALLSSVPPSESQVGVLPQNSELFASPQSAPYEIIELPIQRAELRNEMPYSNLVRPEMMPDMMPLQRIPLQFSNENGIQVVPEFRGPPSLDSLSPLEQALLLQQLVAPQYQNYLAQINSDPRMMMPPPQMNGDPRMMMPFGGPQKRIPDQYLMGPPQLDPRMFSSQPNMIPPQMLDPRAFDPQSNMMRPQLIDPRYIGPGFEIDPAIFGLQNPIDQPLFMGAPTKRGRDFMSIPPPEYTYGRSNFGGPYQQYPGMIPDYPGPSMGDPRTMFGAPNQYSQFPSDNVPPFAQNGRDWLPASFPSGGRPPFAQNGDDWSPPRFLPETFRFAQPPVEFDIPVNDSARLDQKSIEQLFGEQSGVELGNGRSEPTSQSKKDQEYKSLLPSNENLESEVVEDVTVKVVKGSKPDSLDDSLETNVPETMVRPVDEDDYVFLMTRPPLEYEGAIKLLGWLTTVMSLPVPTFYDLSVNDDMITFRVNPALQNLNETYIAQTFGDDELQRVLRETNGLEIVRAGIGRFALTQPSSPEEVPEIHFQQTAIVESESSAKADAEIIKKYDVVDPTFAFIVTEPQLTGDKARRILNWLAETMKVPEHVFSNLRLDENQLIFRVSPYPERINASSVVERLTDASVQSQLRQQFAVEIIRAGIGDRVQVVKADNKQRQALLIGLIAVACVAGLLIVLGIIYLVRRNLLIRNKLHGLGGDVESSKEYEELCRQRMASKNLEAVGGINGSPERNPTDRTTHSSTSSWSEEPAPSNMDITTGHMVLSYMEDHLQHKDRLSEEWASLCTYEADPKRTEAGSRVENLIKNRYPDVLPYDHTRVHLKPEANDTKSDYVNANSITDADPKNPAYIATQGPLPETVGDFWQMVWESNSTVMVMLTKLRENDQDLCHVYWPKEGSECYSNFEVHLVSEHIWCDDYLVRNFYLKNLHTHETRTVTQFHYLNWPNLGVPSSLKTFLEFRRKVNKCYKGGSSPIVVLCSDGVDRTGAYCLIDMVLNRMAKGVKEIDIAASLEHLRDQRMDMVRTKEQFEFVLTAVAQEIQAILKSMPPQK